MNQIDVFLKTYDLADECIKNIKRWIDIFNDKKYKIKLIIPENRALYAHKVFPNIPTFCDINLNLNENSKYKQFFDRLTGFHGPGRANLTCYKYAESSFFWNIDADDTFVEMNCKNDALLLGKLKLVENISIDLDIHANSMDFYRLYNCRDWLDHWSFGICFMKNDFDSILNSLENLEIRDRGFSINSDHIFDTIRHKKNIKIFSFAITNSTMIHPTFGHIKGDHGGNKSCIHYYNENTKHTTLPCGVSTNEYSELNDYMVIK